MTEQKNDNRYSRYEDVPLFLGVSDLMNVLGLSRTTVYYMMRADDFPTIIIGNRRLVRKEKLIEWLEAHENNNEDALRHPQPFRRPTLL